MATNNSLKKQLSARKKQSFAEEPMDTLKKLLNSEAVKRGLEEVLKEGTPHFTSSVLSLVKSNECLQGCEPLSIIASCLAASVLALSIDKDLGYVLVLPYKNRAVLQFSYKGYIQLALRTSQYKTINILEIHEGELKAWNPLNEELFLDLSCSISKAVTGYAGYFELLNGFKKTVYFSKEQIDKLVKKFSCLSSELNEDFNALAKKLVLRDMLTEWGGFSEVLQKAYKEELVAENLLLSILKEETGQNTASNREATENKDQNKARERKEYLN